MLIVTCEVFILLFHYLHPVHSSQQTFVSCLSAFKNSCVPGNERIRGHRISVGAPDKRGIEDNSKILFIISQ